MGRSSWSIFRLTDYGLPPGSTVSSTTFSRATTPNTLPKLPKTRGMSITFCSPNVSSKDSTYRRRRRTRLDTLRRQHLYVEVPGGDHSLFVREDPETLARVFSFFNIVGKDQRGVR